MSQGDLTPPAPAVSAAQAAQAAQVVRGRYAPSPTGHLTVGNAYTAVRAWLDVKSKGGEFVLRLDDTDPERSVVTPDVITDALSALGLTWDEGWDVGGPYGPYVTSLRRDRHIEVAEQLVEGGHAYWDYTPPIEDVDTHKKSKGAHRGRAAYRGNPRVVAGIDPVLRLRVGDEPVTVTDRVFGEISVKACDIAEVALLRSDRSATYHLASCVDDVDMGITSVLRGADWLNFLPQHVLLYQALGADPLPTFAHIPLLIGKDGQKLSKRAGDLAVRHLVDEVGIPPAALCAYLANLGFPERPDLLELDELCVGFNISEHNRASPRYDPKKLDNFCRRWLAEKEADDSLSAEILARSGVGGLDSATVRRMLPGIRVRIATYQDGANLLNFLSLADMPGRNPALVTDAMVDVVLSAKPWDAATLAAAVDEAVAPYEGKDRKARLMAFRDALAPGLTVTPPIHYLLVGLGLGRSRARLGPKP